MKTNYHTHTARCGHASGTDAAYARAAFEQGFTELGFSDHMPWPYRSGFRNARVRMAVTQMDDYLDSIRALQAEYAGRMRILVGFECEYFPAYMDWLAQTAREKALDYLILGNHYDESDETGGYFGLARTAHTLRRYVDSTVRGIETGLFAYLAHPDLFMRSYPRFDENCRAAAHDLCAACRAAHLPMEYNVHDRYLGLRPGSYPHPAFFDIVREEGVPVLIGLDAHEPRELSDMTQWNAACRELAPFGELWQQALTPRRFGA